MNESYEFNDSIPVTSPTSIRSLNLHNVYFISNIFWQSLNVTVLFAIYQLDFYFFSLLWVMCFQ